MRYAKKKKIWIWYLNDKTFTCLQLECRISKQKNNLAIQLAKLMQKASNYLKNDEKFMKC